MANFASDPCFTWNNELSRDENFHQWYCLNTSERESWGEKPHPQPLAEAIFNREYRQVKLPVIGRFRQRTRILTRLFPLDQTA